MFSCKGTADHLLFFVQTEATHYCEKSLHLKPKAVSILIWMRYVFVIHNKSIANYVSYFLLRMSSLFVDK